jgi:hypothetical protein
MTSDDIVKELRAIRKDLGSQKHCKGGSSSDGGGWNAHSTKHPPA